MATFRPNPSVVLFGIALAAGLLCTAAEPAAGRAATGAAALPGEQDQDVADMDLRELVKVRVSPFTVSTRGDRGYRASNSVSGSRFDAPIRNLPFAIQAFTESFIGDQKPLELFDIARYSPGVTYRSNDFNEGNANLAIRGFAVGSLAGGNIHALRDGFHGPSILDFTNVSRLEIVKGPASFLYGQVAPGGIVNVITKSPQAEFAARADARYGSYGQYRFSSDVTGPATSNLFYRLATSYNQEMHYWKPYDANSWDIAPSLRWEPSDRVSVSLKYENYRKEEEPQLMQKPGYNRQQGLVPTRADPNLSGVDVPGLPSNWNSMSDADYRRSESSQVSSTLDVRVDDHWNWRTGYSHLDYQVDALFSGNFGMANNRTFLQGRRVRHQIYSNRDDTIETEALGRYAWDWGSLRLLLGAQYIDRIFDRLAGQAPNDPALGSDPIASPLPLWDLRNPTTWNRVATLPVGLLTESRLDQSVRYLDRSVYGGGTLGLLDDRLLLLAGWRWTSTESRFKDRTADQRQPAVTVSRVTPQYGVLYRLTPQISLFGTYSESFVPGTFPVTNLDGSRSPSRPTVGRGYDIGLKAELFGGRVSGTLTYFDLRNRNVVNDLAVTDAAGIVTIYNVQSGVQRSQGIELDLTANPTDNWQIYLSYSYMHARITEFSGNDDAILARDPATLDSTVRAIYKAAHLFHGAPLQMSAPHLANLWTRYDFSTEWLRGFHVAGGVNIVCDQTLLPDTPGFARQSYALLNAAVGYSWQMGGHRLSVDLMGKNLADEEYRPSQSTRSRPREFFLNFSASF